jgi:hypothetical protein
MAYTLIGGTAIGTILILVFLPALYATWFRVKPATADLGRAERQLPNDKSSGIGISISPAGTGYAAEGWSASASGE